MALLRDTGTGAKPWDKSGTPDNGGPFLPPHPPEPRPPFPFRTKSFHDRDTR